MSTPAIQGPVPPYSNVNINAQYYIPNVFEISNISLGVNTTITTAINHNYVIGQIIRLNIPESFGCTQINQKTGQVLEIPSNTQVLVNINSVDTDSFISSTATTKPQIVAVGDINSGPINASGRNSQQTFINGSFINISPI